MRRREYAPASGQHPLPAQESIPLAWGTLDRNSADYAHVSFSDCQDQLMFIWAARTTRDHSADSALICAARSSGVPVNAPKPSVTRRSLTSGSETICATRRLSASTMSLGVPAG